MQKKVSTLSQPLLLTPPHSSHLRQGWVLIFRIEAMENNNDEIISRRQDELDALRAFYGHQLRSSLSSNDDSTHDAQEEEANDETISVNGPWFIELIDLSSITMNNDNSTIIQKSLLVPTLEINLPSHYPSSQAIHPPTPTLHNVNESHLTLSQQQVLLDELMEMYEPDMDVAIMWAERCRMEFVDVDLTVFTAADDKTRGGGDKTHGDGRDDLPATTTNATTNNNNDKSNNHHYHSAGTTDTTNIQSQKHPLPHRNLCIKFLTFNHLLHGKSHKKESQIVALASKSGLIGLVVYGTPGVIGLLSTCHDDDDSNGGGGGGDGNTTISTTTEDIIDFTKECNRIGKRATLLDYTLYIIANDEDDGRLVLCSSPTMNGVGQQNKNKIGGMRSTTEKKSSNTNNKKKGGSKKNNKSNNTTDYPSTSSSTTTLPSLSNLLGSDDILSMKAGLRHFDSFAELKEVLPESTIQSILGLKIE